MSILSDNYFSELYFERFKRLEPIIFLDYFACFRPEGLKFEKSLYFSRSIFPRICREVGKVFNGNGTLNESTNKYFMTGIP